MKSTMTSSSFRNCLPILVFFSLFPLLINAQTFYEITDLPWGQGINFSKPNISDIDGDDRLDLLIGSENGKLAHFEQESANSDVFLHISDYFCDIDVGDFSAPFVVDIDNDNLLDLIIGTEGHLVHYEQASVNSYQFSLITENFIGNSYGNHTAAFALIDNDDLLDMLVSCELCPLSYYEQTSPGSYDFNLVSSNFCGISVDLYAGFSIADFDDDGRLDILNGWAQKINLYEQSSPGSLVFELVTYSFENISSDSGVAPYLTDLNDEPGMDLLIGTEHGRIFHHRQMPLNSLEFNLIDDQFINTNSISNNAPCLTDIDNDNLTDILIGRGDGHIYRYEQSSQNPLQFSLVTSNFSGIDAGSSAFPVCMDIDLDGLLDLLVGCSTGHIVHYEQAAPGGITFNLQTENFNNITTGYYSYPVLYDLDNDGLTDLLAGRTPSGEYVHYEQLSPGSYDFDYIPGGIDGLNSTYIYNIMITEIDGDGRRDVLASFVSQLMYYEETYAGSCAFELVTEYFYNNNSHPVPVIADLNNNGRMDLLVGTDMGTVEYLEQDTIGITGFSLVNTNLTGIIDAGTESVPEITDMNQDGLNEMVVGHGNARLSLYEQDSAGSLQFSLVDENFNDVYQYPFQYTAPRFFNLDNDEQLDMMLGFGNRLMYYEQSYNHPFHFTLIDDNFSSVFVSNNAVPLFCNIDNDGLTDLLIGEAAGNIAYYEQDYPQSTSFSIVTDYFNNIDVGGFSSPCIIDLAGDGLLDLFSGCESGAIYHFRQNNPGSIIFELMTPNFNNIYLEKNSVPAFYDLNNDGLQDMFVGSYCGGVRLFLQDSTSTSANQEIYNDHIRIYPVPSKGSLTIESNNRIKEVEIFSVLGKRIYHADVDQNTIQCFLPEIDNGVYLVAINLESEVINKKVVVQK